MLSIEIQNIELNNDDIRTPRYMLAFWTDIFVCIFGEDYYKCTNKLKMKIVGFWVVIFINFCTKLSKEI